MLAAAVLPLLWVVAAAQADKGGDGDGGDSDGGDGDGSDDDEYNHHHHHQQRIYTYRGNSSNQ